jgi:hypothetical protein
MIVVSIVGTIHQTRDEAGLSFFVKLATCLLLRLSNTLNHLQSDHLQSRKAVNLIKSFNLYLTNFAGPAFTIHVYRFNCFFIVHAATLSWYSV